VRIEAWSWKPREYRVSYLVYTMSRYAADGPSADEGRATAIILQSQVVLSNAVRTVRIGEFRICEIPNLGTWPFSWRTELTRDN
jgi:hypothetical protein